MNINKLRPSNVKQKISPPKMAIAGFKFSPKGFFYSIVCSSFTIRNRWILQVLNIFTLGERGGEHFSLRLVTLEILNQKRNMKRTLKEYLLGRSAADD